MAENYWYSVILLITQQNYVNGCDSNESGTVQSKPGIHEGPSKSLDAFVRILGHIGQVQTC